MKTSESFLWLSLCCSIFINILFAYFFIQQQCKSECFHDILKVTETCIYNDSFSILSEKQVNAIWDKTLAEPFSVENNIHRSSFALETAAKYAGERGEGREGWLWLLAAVDLDRGNLHALSNLVDNYMALYDGFSTLAYSELLKSKVSKDQLNRLIKESEMRNYLQLFEMKRKEIEFIQLPRHRCSANLFQTLFHAWDLIDESNQMFIDELNENIYQASIYEYEQLKRRRPDLSPTDLNHALFNVQMGKLESTSSYWGIFHEIDGFDALVNKMRRCALEYLIENGMDKSDAIRKASTHPLVVWVSVHTSDSQHQPHVTDDALVGGVYYVKVSPNSGKLQMFDPRGKSPLRDLKVPTSPPSPPFHRSVGFDPTEGDLVLFPGWLVHSVMPGDLKNDENGWNQY